MSDAKVQVAPDSTGAKIRTIEVQTLISDAPNTVEQQVVTLADDNGEIMTFKAMTELLFAILQEMKNIRAGMEILTDTPLREQD